MTAGIVWTAARDGLRGLFHYLAPFLWFIGALEHPPIRIRRRDD